jgi:hypothetical protein
LGDGQAATNGGAEEFVDGGGAPVAPDGGSGLLQHEVRGVRCGPVK